MDVYQKKCGGGEREACDKEKDGKLQDAEVRKVFEVKVAESLENGCKDGDVWERYKFMC